MRYFNQVCLLFVFAFANLASYALATEPETQIQNVNLRGRVELGGKPVAGAQVSLWATTGC